MDPLTTATSFVTVAVKSTNSLIRTIARYKERNRTLTNLQDEVRALNEILKSLTELTSEGLAMLALLQGPIERCSLVCSTFEKAMEIFGQKSKVGFLDWTKMEFMKGDINEFRESVTGYKLTISVGIGIINLHTSKVSQKALEEYNEIIHGTVYNLELHLQQIDEKLAALTEDSDDTSLPDVDLEDERAVTKQCLHICEDAQSHLDKLINKQPSLLRKATPDAAEGNLQDTFEAQILTLQTLEGSQENLGDVINHLQKRLRSLVKSETLQESDPRQHLQDDIEITKQCLDVCKVAGDISRQKVFRVGEVVVEDNSDNVVINTAADLFDVKKAFSKNNSALLVSSTSTEGLELLVKERYRSRYGAFEGQRDGVSGTVTMSPSGTKSNKSANSPSASHNKQNSRPGDDTSRLYKPSPNEMRKRTFGNDDEDQSKSSK